MLALARRAADRVPFDGLAARFPVEIETWPYLAGASDSRTTGRPNKGKSPIETRKAPPFTHHAIFQDTAPSGEAAGADFVQPATIWMRVLLAVSKLEDSSTGCCRY